jgi:hypothetical protein
MARPESETPLWSIEGIDPQISNGEEIDIQTKSIELVEFLTGFPLSLVRVDSIISLVDFMPMYSLTLFKTISHDEMGNNVTIPYQTDSAAIRFLSHEMKLMPKKEKKNIRISLRILK